MSTGAKFTPRIVGLICNWCCYGGADLCGVSRFQYPPYIRLIRIMCSGRVDYKAIFQAFEGGADGLFIGGCHLDDCHYITHGNYDAWGTVQMAHKILECVGVDPRRLRLEWVSAGEGIRFANIMNQFSAEIEKLGSLGTATTENYAGLQGKLKAACRLVPYLKMVEREHLRIPAKTQKAYEDVYGGNGFDRLFDTLVAAKLAESQIRLLLEDERYSDDLCKELSTYYIDPAKCKACGICARKCPVGAISGAKKQAHVIDQDKCVRCGTCMDVCPERFDAVSKTLNAANSLTESFPARQHELI